MIPPRYRALSLLVLAHCRRETSVPAPSTARVPATVPAPEPRPLPATAPDSEPGRAVLDTFRLSPDGTAAVFTAVLERAPQTHAVVRVDLREATLRWAAPLRSPRGDGGTDPVQVVSAARWSAEGAQVVVHWPGTGTLGVVDARDGSLRARHEVPAFGQTVAFGEGALFGDPFGVEVRRLPALAAGPRLIPSPAAVYFAAISGDGSRAALPGDDGLAVYDLVTGTRPGLLHHETATTRITLSRNGSRVAEIRGGNLRVWSVEASPRLLLTVPAVDTPHLALAPEGRRVAICGDLQGGLVVHEISTRREILRVPGLRCQGLDFGPGGAWVGAAHYDGLSLLRVDGPRLDLRVIHRQGAWRVETDADGAARAAFFAPPRETSRRPGLAVSTGAPG